VHAQWCQQLLSRETSTSVVVPCCIDNLEEVMIAAMMAVMQIVKEMSL
jgi:hypothetical protein